MIEARSLRREFGETTAIDGVSFAVEEGSVCALVGPNGAGKTTLLRMLAGLLEPSAGTAVVAGIDLRGDPRAVHARLGFLPDSFGLYNDLSAREYLRYFHLAYRLPAESATSRIEEVLAQVGLDPCADRRVETLSRGMRQRLGLARTLLHDPSLLLLDEPASGLDPGARTSLQELLRSLARAGKTIVVSSHILSELESYCSHLVILDQGHVVFAGSIPEAREQMEQSRRLRLRTVGDLSRAQSVVQAHGAAGAWKVEGDAATFDFAGDDRKAAALLKSLIEAGVPVVSFGEAAGTLQDSYLLWMGSEAR